MSSSLKFGAQEFYPDGQEELVEVVSCIVNNFFWCIWLIFLIIRSELRFLILGKFSYNQYVTQELIVGVEQERLDVPR